MGGTSGGAGVSSGVDSFRSSNLRPYLGIVTIIIIILLLKCPVGNQSESSIKSITKSMYVINSFLSWKTMFNFFIEQHGRRPSAAAPAGRQQWASGRGGGGGGGSDAVWWSSFRKKTIIFYILHTQRHTHTDRQTDKHTHTHTRKQKSLKYH